MCLCQLQGRFEEMKYVEFLPSLPTSTQQAWGRLTLRPHVGKGYFAPDQLIAGQWPAFHDLAVGYGNWRLKFWVLGSAKGCPGFVDRLELSDLNLGREMQNKNECGRMD